MEQQWEYSADDYSNGNLSLQVTALNNSAKDGWMLVSAVPVKSANGEDETRFIFKRPKH
jgi:Domain of unknown function (DUF4177)